MVVSITSSSTKRLAWKDYETRFITTDEREDRSERDSYGLLRCHDASIRESENRHGSINDGVNEGTSDSSIEDFYDWLAFLCPRTKIELWNSPDDVVRGLTFTHTIACLLLIDRMTHRRTLLSIQSVTWNLVCSKDNRARCFMTTSDGSKSFDLFANIFVMW